MARYWVFADESGNFDFRPHGKHPGASKYFAVGTMVVEGDAAVELLDTDLTRLRLDLLARGHELPDGFHATINPQAVRDEVYATLNRHPVRYDVTILEKAKAQPQTRVDDPTFYQYAWFYHFKKLAADLLRPGDELVVVAASIGTRKLQAAFRKAVERVVTQCVDFRVPRRVAIMNMLTEPCLQATDYGLWAVMRHWEGGDPRALLQINTKVRSQFDLWAIGRKFYY